jgi:CotH kinase protein/Chitobiase/beta-hexosaminidase C-terminal domain
MPARRALRRFFRTVLAAAVAVFPLGCAGEALDGDGHSVGDGGTGAVHGDARAASDQGFFLDNRPQGSAALDGPGFGSTSTSADAPVDLASIDPPPAPPSLGLSHSVGSRMFIAPFSLRLETTRGDLRIYYTLDGAPPTEKSPVYAAPILIDRTRQVRALAVGPGTRLTASEVYLQIDTDLAAANSNLPLVFLHSFAAPEPAVDNHAYTPAVFAVSAPAPSFASPAGPASSYLRAGWKVRGNTSRHLFAQRSFAIELWDEDGEDRQVSVLGLPSQSDWVLHGPYATDRALMRNALVFALSNRIGRYAPRTRFVELYVESAGRVLTPASYRGVYTLIEKIKRDPFRVPIAHLKPTDTTAPAITGGYIFKVDDNLDPDEKPFIAGGRRMELVEPKSTEITAPQLAYLTNYVNEAVAALSAPGGIHPITRLHYSAYIDVDSWIDFHILNVFVKNADALRLSAYFHKERNGKLVAGPLWDFDRSMGANDDRVTDPAGWNVPEGTQVFQEPWWKELFADPVFEARYWQRWEELLANHLRNDVLLPYVSSFARELAEAEQRHYARWPEIRPGFGYVGEIVRLTNWLDARIAWVKANLRKR